MKKYAQLSFSMEKGYVGGVGTSALFDPAEQEPIDGLVEEVLDSLGTDLRVTIGDTTLFLAAWRNPEHWADDIAEELGCDLDDAPARVYEILEEAVIPPDTA